MLNSQIGIVIAKFVNGQTKRREMAGVREDGETRWNHGGFVLIAQDQTIASLCICTFSASPLIPQHAASGHQHSLVLTRLLLHKPCAHCSMTALELMHCRTMKCHSCPSCTQHHIVTHSQIFFTLPSLRRFRRTAASVVDSHKLQFGKNTKACSFLSESCSSMYMSK